MYTRRAMVVPALVVDRGLWCGSADAVCASFSKHIIL